MSIYTIIKALASQIKEPDVKLPKKRGRPHKIKDDNQSIKNGVVNEKSNADLRSSSSTRAGRR